MVTAEMALALPALAFAAIALAWLLGLGQTQVQLAQATREGARAAARGEPASAVQAVVRELAPDAAVWVRRSGHRVVVTATVHRNPPLAGLRPLAGEVRASATTWWEGT